MEKAFSALLDDFSEQFSPKVTLKSSLSYCKEIKGRDEEKKINDKSMGAKNKKRKEERGGEREREANLQSAFLSLTRQNW